MDTVNLTNHFLIAMPALDHPYFARTLTYICKHNEDGALGVVVNRPIDLTLEGLLAQIDIPLERVTYGAMPVYFGGPVQTDRGFVLHSPLGNWQSTLAVNDRVGLTTSKDILQQVGRGDPPAGLLVTLGYAGWEPGQLEHEIKGNSWLTVEARMDIVFDLPPEQRLPAALEVLGVDPARLSDEAGHA